MPLPVLMRRFALHQVLSFFVMFACLMLGAPFGDSVGGLIISGVMELLAGMLVPYSFRKTPRAACWIWVLPTALLILGFIHDSSLFGIAQPGSNTSLRLRMFREKSFLLRFPVCLRSSIRSAHFSEALPETAEPRLSRRLPSLLSMA